MRIERPQPSSLWILAFLLAGTPAPAATQNWVAAWASAPADPGILGYPFQAPGGFKNRSVRNVVRCSVAGRAVRVRVSNVLGTATVVFDQVYVGLQQRGSTLVGGSNRAVTFGGARPVAVPPGAVAVSDPVTMTVTPAQNLVVSLFMANSNSAATAHPAAFQDNYISEPGNFAGNEDGRGFTLAVQSWFFLSGVDVLAGPQVQGAIVAFGDSITDGDGSSPGANRRWADVLLRNGGGSFAVVNAGIGGNRLLSNSPCFGVSALARLGRDVFSQTGVRGMILLEGINDLIHPEIAARGDKIKPCVSATQVSAKQIISAYQQIAAQAHARGLKIYAGTILPFQGFMAWTRAGEARRRAVNQWIKSSRIFDGVIDFAKVMSDPQDSSRLARGKDSGDHLHPNDAGYAAMGNAIDPAMLRMAY